MFNATYIERVRGSSFKDEMGDFDSSLDYRPAAVPIFGAAAGFFFESEMIYETAINTTVVSNHEGATQRAPCDPW